MTADDGQNAKGSGCTANLAPERGGEQSWDPWLGWDGD